MRQGQGNGSPEDSAACRTLSFHRSLGSVPGRRCRRVCLEQHSNAVSVLERELCEHLEEDALPHSALLNPTRGLHQYLRDRQALTKWIVSIQFLQTQNTWSPLYGLTISCVCAMVSQIALAYKPYTVSMTAGLPPMEHQYVRNYALKISGFASASPTVDQPENALASIHRSQSIHRCTMMTHGLSETALTMRSV